MTPRSPLIRPRGALAAACLVVVVTGACSRASVEEVATTAAVPVVVAVAKNDTLRGTVVATGLVTVAPGAELTVVAPAAGRLAEIAGAEGDTVRAGAALVRFDIPTLVADVSARRAAVSQAAARVEAARAAFTRLSGLLAQGVAAPRDVEDAKRQHTEAEADLEQARSAVDAAVAVADRGVVLAPFTGVIAKRFHNPGDLVDAAAADPIVKLIDPARLEVTASIAAADFSRVATGQAVQVEQAGAETSHSAVVVAKSPQIDAVNSMATVRIAFRQRADLAVGTPVRVSIVTDERRDVLAIPVPALVTEDDELFVMVAGSDNKAHKYPVAVGLSSRGLVQVTSGIKVGDRVIVRGQDGLPEGASVSVEAQ